MLSDLLAQTRREAGLSQLELSLRLEVSQRHVSFVERDRARPSRPLLVAWLNEVNADPHVINAAMLRAGYAHGESGSAPELLHRHPARKQLSQLLQCHSPNPAFVFDADWMIVEANAATTALCSLLMSPFMEEHGGGQTIDMIEASIHPGGLYSRMRNPLPAAEALLAQLRSEEWARPELRPRADVLDASIHNRFRHGGPRASEGAAPLDDHNFSFVSELGTLNFFRVQMIHGLPQDVTPSSLRVELWYASDDETRALLDGLLTGKLPTSGKS